MARSQQRKEPADGGPALSRETSELLEGLRRFTDERIEAAGLCRESMLAALSAGGAVSIGLHAFLRECWAALDGVAREVNASMYQLFPDAGLYAPMRMTRQSTLYMVRKKLREGRHTAQHPVSRFLYEQTRQAPAEAYERLSFLRNLSLFLPLALLPQTSRLPGSGDVSRSARQIVKGANVAPADVGEGTEQILEWVKGFVAECRRRLAEALRTEPEKE